MSSLKNFILQTYTPIQILADFRDQFPEFDTVDDAVVNRVINQAFLIVPNGVVNCGIDHAYQTLLFGIAHILYYQDALTAGGVVTLKKDQKSKSAQDLSITYENPKSLGTPGNINNYFSTSAYGLTVLELLDVCGLTMSCGGFVV